MKRADLLRKLRAIAKAKGYGLVELRDRGDHTIYLIGGQRVPVPRHREINELTANGIIQTAENVAPAPPGTGTDAPAEPKTTKRKKNP
jgi:mRNA interferase HicA